MKIQKTIHWSHNTWVYVVSVALAVAHITWAVSMLLEHSRYVYKLPNTEIFAALHVISALLLIAGRKTIGGGVSLTILFYYWLYVKPLEPIAEPQSVGLIFLSITIMTGKITNRDISSVLLRLTLAYPFLEWGIDAFRNPGHFIAFMQSNYLTSVFIPSQYLLCAAFTLGVIEVTLAVLLVLGVAVRRVSTAAAVVLLIFIIVAGYPLALPQNIPLIAAAYSLSILVTGRYTVQRIFNSFS